MKPLAILLLAIAAWPASHASASLLTNGNMDQTVSTQIVPGFFLPKPAGWVNEGSRSISGAFEDEMSSEPFAGPAPTPVTTGGSGLPSPDGCSGLDCGVFFKPFTGNATDGATTAHLYQDNPATPGLEYLLTGWAGAEPNALGDYFFALDFLDAGNGLLASSELDLIGAGLFDDNGQPFDYKQFSLSAVAPAGAATVRARISMVDAMANPAGGGQAFVVDDFVLTSSDTGRVPEPATGLLAATGIAALAWGRRRRTS